MVLNLEKNHPGIFANAITNFNDVKAARESLDENGKPKKVSWEEAFVKFYYKNQYKGVTKENEDIAELFSKKGLSQNTFEMAKSLREEGKQNNIPEHILEEPLKEDTILESIEKLKKQTEQELSNGKEIIEELYEKQFTYEWLSKNDPHNSIMGLFCSCCGSITSSAYGKDIAKSSIIAPDVQNIVVRNSNGNIISKGTMYLNKDQGYAVINDFELNAQYRHHEKSEGRYDVEENSKDEKERELIFKAFQRGLKAFTEKYDQKNPNKPIKQINIGMGYNRLKKQVERFKKETSNLTVPAEYSFKDAESMQYILYKKDEKQIEKEGDQR